jgi:hypothetical protein
MVASREDAQVLYSLAAMPSSSKVLSHTSIGPGSKLYIWIEGSVSNSARVSIDSQRGNCGDHMHHAPCSSSSRTNKIVVVLIGSSAVASGSGMELMNGELGIGTSVPLVGLGPRFVPVRR